MDVSKLCRSCMEEVAPWEREDTDKNTMEMFSFCTNIEISIDDKLPKHFCFNCTVLIESSYTYIRKARRINGKLKKLAQNGSTFVDSFLLKTNPPPEKVEKVEDVMPTNFVEPDKVTDDDNDSKTEMDHDIFDDDDDRCLSEFKSANNENQANAEALEFISNLSNNSKASSTSLSESKSLKENSKITKVEETKCNICRKMFSSKGWYDRHVKTAHSSKKNHAVLTQLQKKDKLNGVTKVKAIKKKPLKKLPIIKENKDIEKINTENISEIPPDNIETNTPNECKAPEKIVEENSTAINSTETSPTPNNVLATNTETGGTKTNKDNKNEKDFKAPEKVAKKKIKVKGSKSNEPSKCRLCSKEFPNRQLRLKHIHSDHVEFVDGQKLYKCPFCGKTFAIYTRMYYHATSHPEISKFPCETCGRVFRVRKELEQHHLSHTKERPFACDKCGMKFKLKGILAAHLKWHEGVRPYLCNVCGRSFTQSGNLESHMRVHTGEQPFACSSCAFRSTSQVSLKRHERRHRGERPYPCSVCPKRFFESSSLTRHMRSHTHERPYKCPSCARAFFDSGKRRRHLVSAHNIPASDIPPMDKEGNQLDWSTRSRPAR